MAQIAIEMKSSGAFVYRSEHDRKEAKDGPAREPMTKRYPTAGEERKNRESQ